MVRLRSELQHVCECVNGSIGLGVFSTSDVAGSRQAQVSCCHRDVSSCHKWLCDSADTQQCDSADTTCGYTLHCRAPSVTLCHQQLQLTSYCEFFDLRLTCAFY